MLGMLTTNSYRAVQGFKTTLNSTNDIIWDSKHGINITLLNKSFRKSVLIRSLMTPISYHDHTYKRILITHTWTNLKL